MACCTRYGTALDRCWVGGRPGGGGVVQRRARQPANECTNERLRYAGGGEAAALLVGRLPPTDTDIDVCVLQRPGARRAVSTHVVDPGPAGCTAARPRPSRLIDAAQPPHAPVATAAVCDSFVVPSHRRRRVDASTSSVLAPSREMISVRSIHASVLMPLNLR